MWSKHRIVDIESAAFPGDVFPINIPKGGHRRLFPKIGLKRFYLESCCK
jgi:hypothetical protein